MRKKILTLALSLHALTTLGYSAETTERTLSIIKPEAVEQQHIGPILSRFEKAGLSIVALKMTKLTDKMAKNFYKEHEGKAFYQELVTYMTSGPVVISALEGPSAISQNRSLMGATNPEKADKGTIRKDFGTDLQQNAVHGSDSSESAQREIAFFFNESEIYPRKMP